MVKKIDSSVSDSDITSYVKERFKYLYSLKQHRYPKYWKFRSEYAQLEQLENTEDGFTNYYMNTWFAIVNAKVSEIFASTPQYDFVGLDENGRKYKKMVEKLWQWIWMNSWTNKAITQIIRESCKYWTWFWIEKFSKKIRKVKKPIIDAEWNLGFEDGEAIDYEGCELIPLDWSNTFVNGADIDNCTEAILITHWDKDEFYTEFWNKNLFTYGHIEPGKMYFTPQNWGSLTNMNSTDRAWDTSDNKNTISVIEYWNKYKDEYIIIANDVHINSFNGWIMPNPNPHKDIPIIVYTDHQIDGDIYGRGEFDITENSRLLKNDSRSLMIETVKMQGGIITIDPSSDFDETVERIGLKQFARVAKEDFWFFSPSVNISPLELLEKKIDEDIIIETWVDFRWQLFWPNETAERSKWRIDSSRKRINTNIRENSYSFYDRLARLRIENIKMYYKGKNNLIPVRWYEIGTDGSQSSVGDEYGTMALTKWMLSGSILLIPIVDSLSWDTSKVQKQKYMEMFQILINLKKMDGSPLVDPAILLDAWRWIIDDSFDLDKVLGWNIGVENEINKRLAERGLPNPNAPMDANGQPTGWAIPPSQMSWKPIMLPSAAANITE